MSIDSLERHTDGFSEELLSLAQAAAGRGRGMHLKFEINGLFIFNKWRVSRLSF